MFGYFKVKHIIIWTHLYLTAFCAATIEESKMKMKNVFIIEAKLGLVRVSPSNT